QAWQFEVITEMALRYIKAKEDQELPDLVDRIIKYEQCGLPLNIRYPLWERLCLRDARPTKEERAKLGVDKVINILDAREELYKIAKDGKLDKVASAKASPIIFKELNLSETPVPSATSGSSLFLYSAVSFV